MFLTARKRSQLNLKIGTIEWTVKGTVETEITINHSIK
jgi:hypothetical protein